MIYLKIITCKTWRDVIWMNNNEIKQIRHLLICISWNVTELKLKRNDYINGIAVLGKIFRETQGLHVIGRDSLHCICRDFTVIALCFEQGLLQYSCLISWWTKWYNNGIIVAKLCRYFINKPKWVTGWQLVWNDAHTHDEKSKASLYVRKSIGKNVTVSRLWYNKIIFIRVKTLKIY